MKVNKLILQFLLMLFLLSLGYLVGSYNDAKPFLKENQQDLINYDNGEIYIEAKPNNGYKFVKWNDGNKSASRPIYEFQNLLVEPVFKKEKITQYNNKFINNNGIITCEHLETGDYFNYNNNEYLVVSNKTLKDMNPKKDDFAHICTSHVTDMSYLFKGIKDFKQDIGLWDTSNVKDMTGMFKDTKNFQIDIGLWDVRNVRWMNNMFQGARSYNLEISMWNISDQTETSLMFADSSVNP